MPAGRHRRRERLADGGEQFAEPRQGHVKGLAALDPVKLDGPEDVVALLILAHDAAFASQ